MAAISKRLYSELIPEEPDRHANRVEIIKSTGNLYHVYFRNLSWKMSKAEFLEWKKAFAVAKEKLGDRMEDDGVWPLWEQ